MTPREAAIRRAVLDNHGETVTAIIDAGRTAVRTWDGRTVTDSQAVTRSLSTVLRERNLNSDLLELLRLAVDYLEGSVQEMLVPAPPYLVVTSRGPICRAALASGERVVVRIELFAVKHEPARYRFQDPEPRNAVRVTIH